MLMSFHKEGPINPTNSLGYILAPTERGVNTRRGLLHTMRWLGIPSHLIVCNSLSFPLSSHHNLSCPLAKGFPIVTTVDGFNAEAGCQEEQLQFTGEEDVHIQL